MKVTDDVVAKLEEGFLMGFSDAQASLYAGICTSTFYNYCRKHPNFSKRKELLKENLKMKAKVNLAKEINEKGNKELSRWYLERKEFSGKIVEAGEGVVTVKLSDEVKEYAK